MFSFLFVTRWTACTWAYACSGSLPLDLCIFNCVYCISIQLLVANKVLYLSPWRSYNRF